MRSTIRLRATISAMVRSLRSNAVRADTACSRTMARPARLKIASATSISSKVKPSWAERLDEVKPCWAERADHVKPCWAERLEDVKLRSSAGRRAWAWPALSRPGLLLSQEQEGSVAGIDVGIVAFAAGRAVRAQRIDVERAFPARRLEEIGAPPRVAGQLLDIAALTVALRLGQAGGGASSACSPSLVLG